MPGSHCFRRGGGIALITVFIRFFGSVLFFLSFFFLLFSCVAVKPLLRTRKEIFKAYNGKTIDKSALSKFFDAAQKGNRDIRAMSFTFLLQNSHRFSSIVPFALTAFAQEKDYNVKIIIMASLAMWAKKSALKNASPEKREKVFLMPSENQLLQMMNLAEKELSTSKRLDSRIAAVALMESILRFVATKKEKSQTLNTLASKVVRQCERVAQNQENKLFVQGLRCLKLAREKNIPAKMPVFSHPVKQFLVDRYLHSSIGLQ